jgi:hypothetical protein
MILSLHDNKISDVVKGNEFDSFIKYSIGFTRNILKFCNRSCELSRTQYGVNSLHFSDNANQVYKHVHTKYIAV